MPKKGGKETKITLAPAPKARSYGKAAFIEQIAMNHNISKAEARRAVQAVFTGIESGITNLKEGRKFQIGTFGTFTVAKGAARMGRNPKTGEPIKIKASKRLRFKPSMHLKKIAGI